MFCPRLEAAVFKAMQYSPFKVNFRWVPFLDFRSPLVEVAASTFRCHLVAAVLEWDQRVPRDSTGFTHLTRRRVRTLKWMSSMAVSGWWNLRGINRKSLEVFLKALWCKHSLSIPKPCPYKLQFQWGNFPRMLCHCAVHFQFWTLSLSKMNPRWHFLLTLWRNGAKKWVTNKPCDEGALLEHDSWIGLEDLPSHFYYKIPHKILEGQPKPIQFYIKSTF